MKSNWRDDIYNPQLDRNLVSVLCNRFRERYRFLGGEEITQFIVEDILEVVEEYRRPLPEVKKGQIVWDGAEVDQGRKPGYGLSMKNTKVKPVVLTLISEDDIRMLKEGMTGREVRKLVIERIFNEAIEQGVVLNHVDASLILKCTPTTVGTYVKEVEAEKNVQIPDRGKVHDMGRSVTHKKEIVRYMLQNYSPIEIKRRTHHSGEAVDRYLRDYKRVRVLRGKLEAQEIAFATGLSRALVNEYLDLIVEMEGEGAKGG
jgi:DNA-binding CsgD family transcriptional regulator